MQVFVTSVGRTGSVSFREACRYTQYRTGHETKNGLLEYPDDFIEVSPHLRHCVAHLAAKYPEAKWVHLKRAPEACIASLARLDRGAVMRAYETLHSSILPSTQLIDIAFRYYWSEIDVIEAQLERVPADQRMELHLETISDAWPLFWAWIGAEGDLDGSLASWRVVRNSGRERGDL